MTSIAAENNKIRKLSVPEILDREIFECENRIELTKKRKGLDSKEKPWIITPTKPERMKYYKEWELIRNRVWLDKLDPVGAAWRDYDEIEKEKQLNEQSNQKSIPIGRKPQFANRLYKLINGKEVKT